MRLGRTTKYGILANILSIYTILGEEDLCREPKISGELMVMHNVHVNHSSMRSRADKGRVYPICDGLLGQRRLSSLQLCSSEKSMLDYDYRNSRIGRVAVTLCIFVRRSIWYPSHSRERA